MRPFTSTFVGLAGFAGFASATPTPQPDGNSVLPSSYTLIVYNPNGGKYNGAKIQYGGGMNLFQDRVRSYCPEGISCPNGTETVFTGALYPIANVPGGQDTYVSSTGLVAITVQHSHSLPFNATWAYEGFRLTALSPRPARCPTCPASDPHYDCTPPPGYFTWRLEQKGIEGLQVCPNEYSPEVLSVYATTPGFSRTGCTGIAGLAVRDYEGRGPIPPVWSYV